MSNYKCVFCGKVFDTDEYSETAMCSDGHVQPTVDAFKELYEMVASFVSGFLTTDEAKSYLRYYKNGFLTAEEAVANIVSVAKNIPVERENVTITSSSISVNINLPELVKLDIPELAKLDIAVAKGDLSEQDRKEIIAFCN
jgi:hypothetical protein